MSFSLGVVQTLSACVKLFTPEGGSVLIQTPVYSEFYDMTEAWNRKVLENQFVEKDGKWTVDWADFEEELEQADLFLLCSPHNPLGHVWTEEELRRMGITNLYACIAYPVQEDEYLTRNSAQFHEHLGFTLAGTFRRCGYKFGRWYDMVWMEKLLAPHRPQQPPIIPYPNLPHGENV